MPSSHRPRWASPQAPAITLSLIKRGEHADLQFVERCCRLIRAAAWLEVRVVGLKGGSPADRFKL